MLLRHKMEKKLKEIYSELLKYYKKNDASKIKLIKQIIDNFDDTVVKNNIVTELIEIYSVNNNPKRDFIKKLDSNKYLIGFNNGVYDLKEFIFREGKYDDYISMSVGYDYIDKHTEQFKLLNIFLCDIQPVEEERNYILTYFSICLVGNLLELFTILSGIGRNGKTKFVELVKMTFGDYFGAVESQMFTRPRPSASSPDPGLLNLMKKKIIVASEPEKNSKLNSGFIKFITGRDTTTLRNCHQNEMIDFKANFVTFLLCNVIPDVDDMDNAFSKRLRSINFPTEFVDNPSKENEKKINAEVNDQFQYWKQDFMLLLISYYAAYSKKKELITTANILKWTNIYKESTDLYLSYLNEQTEKSESHIHTAYLYADFKIWFKANNPNEKIPNNREFINGIKKYHTIEKSLRINKKISCGIKNIKLLDSDFDEN